MDQEQIMKAAREFREAADQLDASMRLSGDEAVNMVKLAVTTARDFGLLRLKDALGDDRYPPAINPV